MLLLFPGVRLNFFAWLMVEVVCTKSLYCKSEHWVCVTELSSAMFVQTGYKLCQAGNERLLKKYHFTLESRRMGAMFLSKHQLVFLTPIIKLFFSHSIIALMRLKYLCGHLRSVAQKTKTQYKIRLSHSTLIFLTMSRTCSKSTLLTL